MTKLTTLNLRGRIEWQKRENNILDYIEQEEPDIIFFQEVVYLPEVSPYNQVNLLNRQLKYPYEQAVVSRLQTSPLYHNYREGLAILSKFPIVNSETIVLKQNPLDHLQRIVLLFTVDFHGHQVKYANIHFSENPEFAYEHLAELLEILDSRRERRIIVGDFNMPDLKHSILWQHQYTASISEPYISMPTIDSRIDYILMPKSDLFVDISLSPDGLSDHRALTADIRLRV